MVNSQFAVHFKFLDKKDISPDLFAKTDITSQTPLEEKVKIVNQNKGKRALIKNINPQRNQREYVLGIINPIDKQAFGLYGVKNLDEITKNYYLPVFYNDLSELIVSIK